MFTPKQKHIIIAFLLVTNLILITATINQQNQIQQLQNTIQNINSEHVVQQWLIEHYGVSSIDELVQQKLKEYGVQYTGNPFTTALYPGQLQAENITGMHWYTYVSDALQNRTDVIAYPEQPASYIIFGEDTDNDGVLDIIYAKNCTTGQIEYSGDNASYIIQTCINQLTNGGEIIVRAGTYIITNTILIQKSNVYLIAECGAKLVRSSQSSDVIKINNYAGDYDLHNIIIRGFEIDGNRSTVENIKGIYVSGYEANISKTHDIIIENNKVYNCPAECISVDRSTRVTVRNNILYDGGWQPLAIFKSDQCFIENNWIVGTDGYGAINANGARNSVFIGNIIQNVSDTKGLHMDGLAGFPCYNNRIIANYFTNLYYGLTSSKFGSDSKGHLIIGNVFNGCSNLAINLGSDGCIIKGNIFVNDTIWITGSSNLIYGNMWLNASASCITLAGSGHDNVIYGNYFRGVSRGITEKTSQDYNIIFDNIFQTTYTVYRVGANSIWKHNVGFVTENSGVATNLADGSYIAHGLAGTPTTVTLTCLNSTYGGVPVIVSWDKTNTDATNIAVHIYWSNGTAITDPVIAVSWRAEYKP